MVFVQPYGSRTRRGAALHCRGPGSTKQVPSTSTSSFATRSSTPRRAPQTPKLCQHTRLIRISGFPRSPKTQGPKGVQSRMCCHSFLGFGFNSKPQPHRRVGLKIPLARRVHFPGGAPHRDPICHRHPKALVREFAPRMGIAKSYERG